MSSHQCSLQVITHPSVWSLTTLADVGGRVGFPTQLQRWGLKSKIWYIPKMQYFDNKENLTSKLNFHFRNFDIFRCSLFILCDILMSSVHDWVETDYQLLVIGLQKAGYIFEICAI